MNAPLAGARPPGGLTYDAYLAAWRQKLDASLAGLDKSARRYLYYARYNMERSAQVEAAYEPSPALREAMAGVAAPQTWMVLTEDWCVDSAFSLPVIAEAAALSPHVTLRIVPRDDNLGIMDRHLTAGARSIPKLVAFGADGAVLFAWGPRPAELQAQREQLKADGIEAREISRAVLAWYEQDGWRQVDVELAEAVPRGRQTIDKVLSAEPGRVEI